MTTWLTIRCSSEQKQQIVAAAKLKRLDTSEYARTCIMRSVKRLLKRADQAVQDGEDASN